MADKIATARSIPSKMYLGRRRVNVIYNARTKGQVFPFAPPLPIIDLIDPSSSMSAGGSTVTITGAYFSSVSAVRFGTTAAAFQIVNSTTIVATVPAGALGNTTVTVTNATGVSNAYPFAYVDRAPAQRIVKAGAYTLPANLSFRDVLGWAADPAYSSTVVVDDGIAVKAGVALVIEGVQLRGGTNGGNRFRIIDTEGNQIALAQSATPITIESFAYTPPIDTVLRTQGYAASGLSGNPTIPDDASTYLMVTPT